MRGIGIRKRIWVGMLIAGLSFASGCERFRDTSAIKEEHPQRQDSPSPTPSSVHLAFGNPSNAIQDADSFDNYLVVGENSTFSYNNSRGTVNWVSWRTTKADLGDSRPRPDFRPDMRLPNGFKRIGYYDYSGSGYDRGHMVPSADRFANAALNEETFMMTNIVPQTGALNQYPWNKLEQYARSQAWRGFDAYQIAGVYGEKGWLKNKVAVPTNCWKVIALVPRGRSADQIDDRTRIIAVDMPNIDGIEDEPWESYATTVRAIEERTGYDLFAFLPRELQDKIETRKEIRSPTG
ncbi:MAG: DNA/RNA non-specific endonuclease, partial [Acidobacteriota bacterium]